MPRRGGGHAVRPLSPRLTFSRRSLSLAKSATQPAVLHIRYASADDDDEDDDNNDSGGGGGGDDELMMMASVMYDFEAISALLNEGDARVPSRATLLMISLLAQYGGQKRQIIGRQNRHHYDMR